MQIPHPDFSLIVSETADRSDLEQAGYIEIEKGYQGKKPHSMIRLTGLGRQAFQKYRTSLQQVMGSLPD